MKSLKLFLLLSSLFISGYAVAEESAAAPAEEAPVVEEEVVVPVTEAVEAVEEVTTEVAE